MCWLLSGEGQARPRPSRVKLRTNLWHIPAKSSPKPTPQRLGPTMASYKEIIALGRDPVRVRAVAHRLLASAEDWTEWERDFLEGLIAEYGSDALSPPQREKLAE